MSDRITVKDVRGMFCRAVRSAGAAGLDPEYWELEQGSKTNGISWKLHSNQSRNGNGTYLRLDGWSSDYLGMTAREAYSTLHTLALAWEAVAVEREFRLASPESPRAYQSALACIDQAQQANQRTESKTMNAYTYRIEIGPNDQGEAWQAAMPATVTRADSPTDLTSAISSSQDVVTVEGEDRGGYRVLVWDGDKTGPEYGTLRAEDAIFERVVPRS